MPTLKSSADTGVRNVPWYLMSGSILASFSLAFWRIRAADSWCEILAVSHSLMTVAHETAQVKTIQKKSSHLSVITVIWQGWNRLSYQLAYTGLQKIFLRTTSSSVLYGYEDFSSFFNWIKTSFLLVWWLKNSVKALVLQALRLCLCQYLGWAHSWL